MKVVLQSSSMACSAVNDAAGAIKMIEGGINASKCHFENNIATIAGGAILVILFLDTKWSLVLLIHGLRITLRKSLEATLA